MVAAFPKDTKLNGLESMLPLVDPTIAESSRLDLYSSTSKAAMCIISGILKDYYTTIPTALASLEVACSANRPSHQHPVGPIRHDHLAFRTFALRGIMSGINAAACFWEGHGYKRSSETLNFTAKKLRARWFAPPMDLQLAPSGCPVPRVFISEVVVDELPWEAQEIIFKYASPQHLEPHVAAAAMTRSAYGPDHQPPWGVPTLEDYQRLQELNPVAAWTLTHGYALNHAAISTHWLEDPDLGHLDDRLELLVCCP